MTITEPPAVEPQPFIMTDPYIALGGLEIHCLASHVELEPETDTTDTTTFCGKRTFPGQTAWHLKITIYQSFDDNGTDAILCSIWDAFQKDGVHPSYEIRPYKNRPESQNNPTFTGTVTPQPYALIAGDAGAASSIDIDWICDQWPTRSPECADIAIGGLAAAKAAAPAPAKAPAAQKAPAAASA